MKYINEDIIVWDLATVGFKRYLIDVMGGTS
jgi:hypothetical protein